MNKLLACVLVLCLVQTAFAGSMCKLPCDMLIDSCITNYHDYDVFLCKSLCDDNLRTCVKKTLLSLSSSDIGCEYNCNTLFTSCKKNCTNSQLCLGVCQAGKDDCMSRC